MIADATTRDTHEVQASRSKVLTCLGIFQATPIERIAIIKDGMPARWVEKVLGDFIRRCGRHLSALGLSSASVARKAAVAACLPHPASECVVGIAGLIGQVETMMQESGDPEDFDVTEWFIGWALSPVPALGGVRPIEYLDTSEGRAVVSRLLTQMQSSAYA